MTEPADAAASRPTPSGTGEPHLGTAKARRPWLAGLLSLWVPGLGQLYSGRWRRALVLWLGGPVLFLGLAFAGLPRSFPGLLAWLSIGLLYVLAVAWDAARLARGAQSYRLRPFNRWYLYLLFAVLTNFAGRALLAMLPVKTFHVPAAAMEPTLQPGDHLIADMTYWRGHAPARGDLVLFTSPEVANVILTKRVIAVAGDRIEIRNKAVFLNGRLLAPDWGTHNDPELLTDPAAPRDNLGPLVVPLGTFFALGDNRDNSYDSRFYGPVPVDLLSAKPLYLYWAADRSRIGKPLR